MASKTLVVVESPAKAKTIKKYLGPGYEVLASKGHIKDLPKKMGVDVERGFSETYEVIEAKAKVLAELKGAAKSADSVLLATDPDREGEAIAWHIAEELKRPNLALSRVEFHEITKKGVDHGVSHPRKLDEHLYDAQRARRVLDRIVGYDVSALVWSKLAFGLSAGRVQSVALRLIVDREREIEAFVPEEYWNIGVALLGEKKPSFLARLSHADGEKLEVKGGEKAAVVKKQLESSSYRVAKIIRREQKRSAPAPYTTSKLQQDATAYLRFTTKRTMQIAQGLYEGVDLGKDGGPVGLITYMRTDSVRVSDDAVKEVRAYIGERFGAGHLPDRPNQFKSRKSAQEAHEAIRPTSMELAPDVVRKHLKDEQYKLYKLVWDRFVASQMTAAVYDQTQVDIEATPTTNGAGSHRSYTLRASGRVLKLGGWLEAYGKGLEGKQQLAGEDEAEEESASAKRPSLEEDADATLPELREGEKLSMVTPPGVAAEQKFTQPPARYNEGSLVRELEKRGIGRPSTYAEIISKVQARDYVEKLPGGGFKPTTLGRFVVDGLVKSALDFMDPNFTANMEEELDAVEAGKLPRVELLSRFYARFRQQLDAGKKQKRWTPEPEDTGVGCTECGTGKMMKRWSKNGWFLGCSNYPKCKNTQDLGPAGDGTGITAPRETGEACDKCGKPMAIRSGRFGEFLSCTGYPACKNAKPVPLGVKCSKCGGDLIEIKSKKKGGRSFFGCSNYATEAKCDFKLWQRPVPEPCPKCGAAFTTKTAGKKPMFACVKDGCGWKRALPDAGEATHGEAVNDGDDAMLSASP